MHAESTAESYTQSESTHRPLERWATLATATAVIAYGVSRRSMSGAVLAAAATPFAYRGLVGEWPNFANGHTGRRDDTRAVLAGDRGINVRESIRLERSTSDVFRFWRQLENLPRFMTHLEWVTEFGDRRSHWVARGPRNLRVEWDAEIINEVEDKVIAWRSLPGSDIVTAGAVTFTPVRGGRGTQVAVNLQYEPPAGCAGALVATIAGREPSQTIREDLRRAKQLLETGETPRTARDRREEAR
jgi:uncharacterized membrane protein